MHQSFTSLKGEGVMTKEEVYDSKICPLMKQIIAICDEHEISMIASYCIEDSIKDDELLCTTALVGPQINSPGCFYETLDLLIDEGSVAGITDVAEVEE